MIEPSIYEDMINYASLKENDTVLDIGAGLGFLTSLMVGKCREVLAVESDAQMAAILREQLAGIGNVKVIEGDVLKTNIPPFSKIVSTPPYNISSHLLLWMLHKSFDRAVLVFQKEFANRLVAPVRSEAYGWLAVLTCYYADVELLDNVPKSMFYPQPKVNSVIVALSLKKPHPFELRNEAAFQRLIRSLFTKRNKKVKGAILPHLRTVQRMSKEEAVKAAGALPFLNKRVRELAPEDFGALANAIR